MNIFLVLFACFCGFIFIFIGSCSTNIEGFMPMGVTFIIGGVLLAVGVTVAYVILRYKRKKTEEEARRQAEIDEANFKKWTEEQGFNADKFIDELIIDTTTQKWCKYLNYKIFNFSDVVKVKTVKHSSQTSYSSSSGSRSSHSYSRSRSNLIFSGSTRRGQSSGSRSGSSRRVSYDTSTYEVHISTKLIDEPLVVIECGYSAATANQICSVVNIMINEASVKTKTKEKPND
ncbi:MAG: hypothetical protein K2K80_06435 [Clostridia bacterium]|nr:hypothetical protein [Clostridia bacterium]